MGHFEHFSENPGSGTDTRRNMLTERYNYKAEQQMFKGDLNNENT